MVKSFKGINVIECNTLEVAFVANNKIGTAIYIGPIFSRLPILFQEFILEHEIGHIMNKDHVKSHGSLEQEVLADRHAARELIANGYDPVKVFTGTMDMLVDLNYIDSSYVESIKEINARYEALLAFVRKEAAI